MIQPLTQGVILGPAVQEDTKSGLSVWIHSFPEQEKLAVVSVPDVCYQSTPLGIYRMK